MNPLSHFVSLLKPGVKTPIRIDELIEEFKVFHELLHRFRKFENKDKHKFIGAILYVLVDHRFRYSRCASLGQQLYKEFDEYWMSEKDLSRIRKSLRESAAFLTRAADILDMLLKDLNRKYDCKPFVIIDGSETYRLTLPFGNPSFTEKSFDDVCMQILWGLDFGYWNRERIRTQYRSTNLVLDSATTTIPIPVIGSLNLPHSHQRVSPAVSDVGLPQVERKEGDNYQPLTWNFHQSPHLKTVLPNFSTFEEIVDKIINENLTSSIDIIEAETGTAKSLFVPLLFARYGQVIVLVHQRIHGRRLSASLNRFLGKKVSVFIDDRNFLMYEHDEERSRLLGTDDEGQGYQSLSDLRPKGYVVFMTYERFNEYLLRSDLPSFIILDDVYSGSEQRDSFLFLLSQHMMTLNQSKIKVIGMNVASSNTLQSRVPEVPITIHSLSSLEGPQKIVSVSSFNKGFVWSTCEAFTSSLTQEERTKFENRDAHLLSVLENSKNRSTLDDIRKGIEQGTLSYLRAMEHFLKMSETLFCPNDFPRVVAELCSLRGQEVPDKIIDSLKCYVEFCEKSTINPGTVLVFVPDGDEVDKYCNLIESSFPQDLEIIGIKEGGESERIHQAAIPLLKNNEQKYRPRIVISDSTAETSVTILGVTIVIDSDLFSDDFTDQTGMHVRSFRVCDEQRRKQRRGRTGRTSPGLYFNVEQRGNANEVIDKLPFGDMKKCFMKFVFFFKRFPETRAGAGRKGWTKSKFLSKLEYFFPTPGRNHWEVIYAQMMMEGVFCEVELFGQVYIGFTRLGWMVVCMPGTFKEGYSVSIASLCGCSRNIIAYIVLSRDIQYTDNPLLKKWIDWFDNNGEDRMYPHSHLQKVLDIAYFLSRDSNEHATSLRMGLDPHQTYRWRRAMRTFEEVIAVSEGRFFPKDHNPNEFSHSIIVTMFALVASSGEDICLYDYSRGTGKTLSNRMVSRFDMSLNEQLVHTFFRIKNNFGDIDIRGLTGIPNIIVALGLDVFSVENNEYIKTDKKTMFVNLVGFSDGEDMTKLGETRRALRNGFIDFVANRGLLMLVNSLRAIDEWYPSCPKTTNFTSLRYAEPKPVAPSSLGIPPLGTQNRKLWCGKCLTQGHKTVHCITTSAEINQRFARAHRIFTSFTHPAMRPENEIIDNLFYLRAGLPGMVKKCDLCESVFHYWERTPDYCPDYFEDNSQCMSCGSKKQISLCGETCKLNKKRPCYICRGNGHPPERHFEHLAYQHLRLTGRVKEQAGWSFVTHGFARNRFIDEEYKDFLTRT